MKPALVPTPAAAYLIAVLACCAGCTAGSAHPSAPAGNGTAAVSAGSTSQAAPPLPARALTSPGCTTETSTSGALGLVRTAMLRVPGNPFGVAVTQDAHWAFVGVGGSVEVLHVTGSLAPAPVRRIPVPGAPLGETVTQDGRYLLAADDTGAVVISVARAERGSAGAVLGTLAALPDGTLLVSDYSSGQVEAVDVASIPGG